MIEKYRLFISGLFAASFILLLSSFIFAEEITILYTGETHAMLYPCNCPKEPDGGIARRAALVDKLRKKNPDAILLDSGSFFAGGLTDEYTQNTELDKQRTLINLQAMKLMKYDAAAVGADEFNFGKEFLFENIKSSGLDFLSSNLESGGIRPYLIKTVGKIKIGIIGVTTPFAAQKTSGIKLLSAKQAVGAAWEDLKKNNADIVILLSNLGEDEDTVLLNELRGIDIVIDGHAQGNNKEPYSKAGDTLVIRPAWQGRKLGKLSLSVADGKISDYKVEEIRLSEEIAPDPQIVKALPECFQDTNCAKKGLIGTCQQPATMSAECKFGAPAEIELIIITSKACFVCDTKTTIDYLKSYFKGLKVSYLYYPGSKAKELMEKLSVKGLPVYLLPKDIEKEQFFPRLKDILAEKDGFYMIKPQAAGVSYFTDRQKIEGRIDLFLSLYNKETYELIEAIRDFQPAVHFLAVPVKEGGFEAATGKAEIEECLRGVCVQKYYPSAFWDYIGCRAKNIASSWWEECLPAGQTGPDKSDPAWIKSCARSEEGERLLKENTALNGELDVMFGPTYLLNNQEIFSTKGTPTKEELKKILKR